MASIPTQEEVLAATRKSQEAMMAAIKTWFDTVRTATPKLATAYSPLTDKLPKLPLASVPFANRLPTPQDAVANAYNLAEQLLASQRKFAEELMRATAPLRPGYKESSREVPSQSAWQKATADHEPRTAPASEPKPVAASEAKPVAASEAKPVAASEAKPVAASEAKAVAAQQAAPAQRAAASTPARPATRSAAAKPAAKRTPAKPNAASPAPKDTDAS